MTGPIAAAVVAVVVAVVVGCLCSAAVVGVETRQNGGHLIVATHHPVAMQHLDRLFNRFDYKVSGSPAYNTREDELTVVNLNLLSDEVLAQDVEDGLQEEFERVDAALGEPPEKELNASLPDHRKNRHMSLMYQGVYRPDERFNPFVDGVLVNLVAELHRRGMDPLYFSVHNRGVVKHIPKRRRGDRGSGVVIHRGGNRNDRADDGSVSASASGNGGTNAQNSAGKNRKDRVAIGGGVLRGLTEVKRFGTAEVQRTGNATLVRSHYVFGPLNIELVFEAALGLKRINTTVTVLAAHGLVEVTPNCPLRSMDFIIDSPSDYEIKVVGGRSRRHLRLSKAAVLRLMRPGRRLETRLQRMFARAGARPLPDPPLGAVTGLWHVNAAHSIDQKPHKNSGGKDKSDKMKASSQLKDLQT